MLLPGTDNRSQKVIYRRLGHGLFVRYVKLLWVLISLKHSFYKGSRSWYGQWPASWDCCGWEGQEGEVHQVSVRIYRTSWSFHGFTGTILSALSSGKKIVGWELILLS